MSKFKIGDSVVCIEDNINYIVTDTYLNTGGFVYLLKTHNSSAFRTMCLENKLISPIVIRDNNFNKLLDE